ncbi:MAG: tRNA (N6-threonylcarbamoyladenosine(37)-N6)-methyltransferase TrmO, partial [Blautia obeum]
ANDPRPRYQNRPDKVYGLAYGHKDIHFQVRDDILTVCDVTEFSSKKSFDKQNNV